MIDWKQARPDDFNCSFDGEDITETGTHIQIPVRIIHRESGITAFIKSVPIRSDFYRDLKKRPDYLQSLVKIVNRRCREMILQKTVQDAMDAGDKVDLINLEPQEIR